MSSPGWNRRILGLTFGLGAVLVPAAGRCDEPRCTRTIVADVVAIDQVYFYNRLGSHAPDGMIYALRRDVVTDASLRLGGEHVAGGSFEDFQHGLG